MTLQVHRSSDAFLEALKTGSNWHYATFDRSATNPRVLRTVEAIARERGHVDLAANPSLRTETERLMRAYFDAAARGDPQSRFAYSSRVLLAIPDYPDLALIFELRALAAAAPASTVHALVEDPWKAALVRFEAAGGETPRFRPGSSRGLARAARSMGRRLCQRRPNGRCDVLIVTLGENLANGAGDAYLGGLAEALAPRCQTLTVYAAAGPRLKLPATGAIAPLEAFLEPLDPLRAWAASRAQGWHDGGEAQTPDAAITAYLRARETHSGEVVMLEVMARAFDRMLARLKPHTVVYPFENRTWERSLLGAARRHGSVRCIGYQHSSITPRHLALRGGSGTDPAELPDAIITCGEVTATLLASEMPQARSRVSVGAALRARRLEVPPPGRPGVLAPISSSRAEAWEILRVMHAFAQESDVPVVVRTHPTIPIDDLYAQFEWPAHVTLSRGRSLAADFADATFVAYSSSTVALEGMLYGRLPIWIDIGDVPSGDPIVGEHSFAFRAASGRELAQTIQRVYSLNAGELAALRTAARAYADRYLIEPSPANVDRMAAVIATC